MENKRGKTQPAGCAAVRESECGFEVEVKTMEKREMVLFGAALCVLFALCSVARAIEVLEPGYAVEIIATYSEPGLSGVKGSAIDDDGNLYITHADSRVIWRVTPTGDASEFIAGIDKPDGIVWGGGSDFGDYLYLVRYDPSGGGVLRVGVDGSVSNFGNMPSGGHAAACIGLDVTGNYGGNLYVGSTGQDHTYQVNTSGNISLWSNFPGWIDGGGPTDICFDPSGAYGGRMFMSTSFEWTPTKSGLFVLDTSGHASRFAPDIAKAAAAEFDPYGLFGGSLFTVGKTASATDLELWRVATDGSISKFATGELAARSIAFAPDGAMYVVEYIAEADEVNINRITPYVPVQVAVDIKPGSCPNPLNLASRGVLPVAILGTEEFDVTGIDTASIRLEGVSPVRSHYEDVATPVTDGNECECNAEGPDGYLDLTLKFKTQQLAEEIVNSLGEITAGDELVLTLTGALTDGTPIVGEDCVIIVGKAPRSLAARRSDLNEDGIVNSLDFAVLSRYWLESAAPK